MLKEGNNPDYRFSLANERTFLSWIRTALAFLAGAVGLDVLKSRVDNPLLIQSLSLLLSLTAFILAALALKRWLNNEKAMRLNQALPYTKLLVFVSFVLIVATGVVLVMIVLPG